MKVAVVTPLHSGHLGSVERCIKSVAWQTHPDVIHILVSDGCDLPEHLAASKNLHHVRLPHNLGDYGDSPRSIGVVYAHAYGADAFAFLDSDNWYEPEHVELMVRKSISMGASVVTSRRYLDDPDGNLLGVCDESDGRRFCDTNCLFLTRALVDAAASWWSIPAEYHAIDDRVIWDRVLHSTDMIGMVKNPTIHYTTRFRHHYRKRGLPPHPEAGDATEILALSNDISNFVQRSISRGRCIDFC